MFLAPKNNKNDWQPSGNLNYLRLRAQILAKIRQFFADREVLEVETPLLCSTTASDPYIASFELEYSLAGQSPQSFYLQTSPEFAMKRLLAAGSGAIYQICKSFRKEEQGRHHNPEFTMLEWYRPSFNHLQLMDEVAELLNVILQTQTSIRWTYQELFEHYLNINPHTASAAQLQQCALQQGISVQGHDPHHKDTWLQLLLSHCIEPKLAKNQAVFIYDFPASQAALAKIREDVPPVAERFEVYVQGIELANGYHELADAREQERRFLTDNERRKLLNLPQIPIDYRLLNALANNFPACAGVALGVDRLIMLAANTQQIADVISFTINNA